MSVRRLKERDGEFGDESLAFEVTHPIALDRAEEEIRAAHNWRNGPGLVGEGSLHEASEESPVVIWVTRTDADPRTVKRLLAAHEGAKAEPTDDDGLAGLIEKVKQGEDLDSAEIQTALRVLLTRGV